MNEQEFIENAIKTESIVDNDKRQISISVFIAILELFISAGNLLDIAKKSYFYNKEYSCNDIICLLNNIFKSQKDIEKYTTLLPLSKTDVIWGLNTLNINTRLLHGIMGLATEGVELIELLRNFLYEVKEKGSEVISNEPDTLVNLKEELGDMEWYKAIIYDEMHKHGQTTFNDSDIREMVINKLKARYGDKFSQESANNRDLDKEKEVLSSSLEKVSNSSLCGEINDKRD